MTDSHTGRYLAPALVACAAATASQAAELTIDRLFDAPALSGPSLVGLKISPDAARVAYLQGKPDDKDRLDLWEYDLLERRARILVDSRVVAPANEQLSTEELGRRERQRTAALSGILEYSFAPSGRALLFPLDGRLYYYDLAKPARDALLQIAPGGSFATDAAISPRGRYVSYVRDQNLFAYDLASNLEKALTHDGAGPIKNGMAEFVAQEEMDRSTGYWWAPDDRHIAFARVDESPVKVRQRFEIAADNVSTFEQRYPAAGEANVLIRLGVSDPSTGAVTWIDLGPDQDIYLARVNWLPDGKTLAIQRESRDQRRLDLLFANIETGAYPRGSDRNQRELDRVERRDLLSRRNRPNSSGRPPATATGICIYTTMTGACVRRLTAGEWNVDDFRKRAIKGIDETHRLIYFTATEKSPIERHLYRTSLDTRNPRIRIAHLARGRPARHRHVARCAILCRSISTAARSRRRSACTPRTAHSSRIWSRTA